jgi:integrase
MARRPKGSVPSLQLHKPSGRARVTINGRDHWLGKWGTPEAQEAYRRLINEFLATGRITPDCERLPPTAPPIETPAANAPPRQTPESSPPPSTITIAEVLGLYLGHCTTYYRTADGKRRTSSYDNALQAARALRVFDGMAAKDFGPRKLMHIRDAEVARGRPRVGCNTLVKSIRRVFRWAESHEYVPMGLHNALMTVEPLLPGRTTAHELAPILPVDDAVVEVTLPYLSPIVADMVRFQRLTGTRPGEVCGLRPVDIERDGEVWKWRPVDHKNAWRKKARVIMIGPKAQAILQKYLDRPAVAYCFSPKESERQRSKARRLARESPLTPSQRARKPKANGRRRPRDHYDNASYRRAISRGVVALNKARLAENPKAIPIEDWAPNRLRHTAGTEVRKKFGLEAAQVVLGHAQADVTQIYAESDMELAAEVVRKIG